MDPTIMNYEKIVLISLKSFRQLMKVNKIIQYYLKVAHKILS